MCSAMLLFGNRLKKCGSIDVTSAATAIFSSWAAAGPETASVVAKATAARAPAARVRMGVKRMGNLESEEGAPREGVGDAAIYPESSPGVKDEQPRGHGRTSGALHRRAPRSGNAGAKSPSRCIGTRAVGRDQARSTHLS